MGWQYSDRFGNNFSGHQKTLDFVRRRKWVRVAIKIPPETATEDQGNGDASKSKIQTCSPNMRKEKNDKVNKKLSPVVKSLAIDEID